ncbi:hypothetical protein [Pseudomonas sp. C9]|uniref:hypothetical protein n=1 Tax=Pseudomonas sp. C9 TaxID=1311337 RepID=UPI000984608C|nr:hypothetical protein [Pseudomonas sp. C9]OOG10680.1 hypothetical protein BMS17_00795 [Pseudomonas sp. C9]
MNAVIKRTSFAEGNYINASAFATEKDITDFIATSRLIDRVKSGPQKTETVKITAIDRPASKTKAKSLPARELVICIPADFAPGEYPLKSRDDVSFSFKDADDTIYEGISGDIVLEPGVGDSVKGNFKIDLEFPDTDGETFLLKGVFQVLKAG